MTPLLLLPIYLKLSCHDPFRKSYISFSFVRDVHGRHGGRQFRKHSASVLENLRRRMALASASSLASSSGTRPLPHWHPWVWHPSFH